MYIKAKVAGNSTNYIFFKSQFLILYMTKRLSTFLTLLTLLLELFFVVFKIKILEFWAGN